MSDLKDPRVLFSAERTLLAWNRTSLSLIAFGFVIERAGVLLHVLRPQDPDIAQVAFTFWLGISFILIGSIASAYSARQYVVVLRGLSPAEFPSGYSSRWGLAINSTVAVLGACLALILIIGRLA